MIIFDDKPRKATPAELKAELGVDWREFPYSRDALKAAFRRMPGQCSFPLTFAEYERGQCGFAITNYLSRFDPLAAEQSRRSGEFLSARLGFPVRVWSVGLLRRAGLTANHQDWYDGVLYNLSGRKIVTVWEPVDTRPPEIYRYRFDEHGSGPGTRVVL